MAANISTNISIGQPGSGFGLRARQLAQGAKKIIKQAALMPLGIIMGVPAEPGLLSGIIKPEIELKGIAVTDKIAFGTALVIKDTLDLNDYPKIDLTWQALRRGMTLEALVEERMDRVAEAFDALEGQLTEQENADKIMADMLKYLLGKCKTKVLEKMGEAKVCASEAVGIVLDQDPEFKVLKEAGDEKFRTIYEDLSRLCVRMLAIKHKRALDVQVEVENLDIDDVILVAQDFSPVDVGLVNNERIAGFVREKGSRKDHMSLRIRDKGRVGLVGVKEASLKIASGDQIILDGKAGKLIINPSLKTQNEYACLMESALEIFSELSELRYQECLTLDGFKVKFMGNAVNPREVKNLNLWGADGIGLVRTEFFFMYEPSNRARSSEPGIKEQIAFYNSIIASAQGKEVVFRTIDPDKDKSFPYFEAVNDSVFNGKKKGLALCLDRENCGPYYLVFRNQIKALLQTKGKIRVMFPLVRSKQDFEDAMYIVEEIRQELAEKGVEVNQEMEFGLMIEHPGVFDHLPGLIEDDRAGFFSLGTNDLTAYLTSTDRYSGAASKYYDELDPRVLRALNIVSNVAKASGTELSLCGDMGNDWRGLLVLLAMGINKISFNQEFMDLARKIVLSVYHEDLEIMLKNINQIKTAKEIRKYIEEFTREKIRSNRWEGLEAIEPLLFSEDQP